LWVVTLPTVQEEAPLPADWDQTIARLEQEYSTRLAELGDVEGRVASGGPREELVQFAKEVDLLIVGSRSYGPWGRLVHGSVSGYLLGHASCSLLVLPRAERA
jgi:nucleotide-binding universal stress UspA family protein